MRILILITALLWAGVSGWWYTCNIKGYCDADPKLASLVSHHSTDEKSPTEKNTMEDTAKTVGESSVESNKYATKTEETQRNKQTETPAGITANTIEAGSKEESANTDTDATVEDSTNNIDAITREAESILDEITVEETLPNPLEEDIAADDDDDDSKIKIKRVNKTYTESDVVPTIKKVRIYSPGNISRQTALNTNAARYFDKVIEMLKTDTSLEITLTGYTDSKGGAVRNKELGLRRAKTLKDILVAKGAPAAQISTDSQGEADPIWSNKSEAGRKKNRRVEIESKNKE